jgi:hypothetical protein
VKKQLGIDVHKTGEKMNEQNTFKRMVAISAIISVPVALATWILVFMAIGSNSEQAVSGMEDIIILGAPAATNFHLAWKFADTFGYSLLLAPMAFYLWRWLKPRNPNLVTFSTLFGFAYILTAAITVSATGGVIPPMMRSYATASESEREILLITFQSVFNLLYYGIGPLVWLFAGVWWIGTGAVLRNARRILGIVTIILGVLSLGVWWDQTFHYVAIFETPFMLFVPIWVLWVGVVIWRRDEKKALPTAVSLPSQYETA